MAHAYALGLGSRIGPRATVAPDVAVASLVDPQQGGLASGPVFDRCQTEPGRQLAGTSELVAITTEASCAVAANGPIHGMVASRLSAACFLMFTRTTEAGRALRSRIFRHRETGRPVYP